MISEQIESGNQSGNSTTMYASIDHCGHIIPLPGHSRRETETPPAPPQFADQPQAGGGHTVSSPQGNSLSNNSNDGNKFSPNQDLKVSYFEKIYQKL